MIKFACTNLIRVVDSQLCLMIRRKKKQKNNQAKQQKQKQTQQVDSQTRLKKNLANLEKKTNLQTRLTLNYIHPTPFHHVYMAQSRHINRNKILPMRVIVSTIGTPPYGISKYLVDIIQPTLNKNQYKVKNSKSFVSQAEPCKIEPDEIQV